MKPDRYRPGIPTPLLLERDDAEQNMGQYPNQVEPQGHIRVLALGLSAANHCRTVIQRHTTMRDDSILLRWKFRAPNIPYRTLGKPHLAPEIISPQSATISWLWRQG